LDASPIILLAKISQIELLTALAESIVIPEGVAAEIQQQIDPAALWLHNLDSRSFRRVPIEPVIATWDLGAGESEVLSWAASNPGFEVIIDDLAARKCAMSLSIPVRGTLGILLLGKRQGLVDKVGPLLSKIRDSGLYVHPDLLNAAYHLADESPEATADEHGST
jgi:predicted nucleic acid-binding protein